MNQSTYQTSQPLKLEWQSLNKLLPFKSAPSILKDLQNILNILQDVKSYTWQKRNQAIEKIKMLFIMTVEQINSDDNLLDQLDGQFTNIQVGQGAVTNQSVYKNDNPYIKTPEKEQIKFIKFITISCFQRIIQPVIIKQINDLRTAVCKEACNLVVWLAIEFPDEFSETSIKLTSSQTQFDFQFLSGGNGVRYFREDALPKLIQSGNKLIQDTGHQAIINILESSKPISKIIPYLASLINTKITLLRQRIAQYFEIILNAALNNKHQGYLNKNLLRTSTFEMIDKNSEAIDIFLIKLTEDQNQEVRNYARYCYILYRQLLPEKSLILLLHGIPSLQVRKQIILDFGLDIKELQQELQQLLMDKNLDSILQTEDQKIQKASILQKTPLKDQMQKLRSHFDEVKTPEQFIRAQKNYKSPNKRSTFYSPHRIASSFNHKREFISGKKSLSQISTYQNKFDKQKQFIPQTQNQNIFTEKQSQNTFTIDLDYIDQILVQQNISQIFSNDQSPSSSVQKIGLLQNLQTKSTISHAFKNSLLNQIGSNQKRNTRSSDIRPKSSQEQQKFIIDNKRIQNHKSSIFEMQSNSIKQNSPKISISKYSSIENNRLTILQKKYSVQKGSPEIQQKKNLGAVQNLKFQTNFKVDQNTIFQDFIESQQSIEGNDHNCHFTNESYFQNKKNKNIVQKQSIYIKQNFKGENDQKIQKQILTKHIKLDLTKLSPNVKEQPTQFKMNSQRSEKIQIQCSSKKQCINYFDQHKISQQKNSVIQNYINEKNDLIYQQEKKNVRNSVEKVNGYQKLFQPEIIQKSISQNQKRQFLSQLKSNDQRQNRQSTFLTSRKSQNDQQLLKKLNFEIQSQGIEQIKNEETEEFPKIQKIMKADQQGTKSQRPSTSRIGMGIRNYTLFKEESAQSNIYQKQSNNPEMSNGFNETSPKPLAVSPRPTCTSRGIDEFLIKKINLQEEEDVPFPKFNFIKQVQNNSSVQPRKKHQSISQLMPQIIQNTTSKPQTFSIPQWKQPYQPEKNNIIVGNQQKKYDYTQQENQGLQNSSEKKKKFNLIFKDFKQEKDDINIFDENKKYDSNYEKSGLKLERKSRLKRAAIKKGIQDQNVVDDNIQQNNFQ